MIIKAPPERAAPLIGLAVGDALGMPFETAHFLESRLLNWTGDFQSSTFHRLSPGQWTDDTMMAKSVAASLVERKGYDPADIAQRYRAWYESGELRGMGSNTMSALRKLSAGVPWVNSGIAHAEGNAPAMRGAMIGIYYRRSFVDLKKVAIAEASITHDSFIAQQGSLAAAVGVSLIINSNFQKKDLAQHVALFLDDSPIRYRLLSIAARAKKDYANAWQELAELGTGSHILQTIPAAFFAFMTADSFQETIETAIRAGGDTDSTAALAGALAGAWYGFEQVQPYLAQLEAADELRALEQRILLEAPNQA